VNTCASYSSPPKAVLAAALLAAALGLGACAGPAASPTSPPSPAAATAAAPPAPAFLPTYTVSPAPTPTPLEPLSQASDPQAIRLRMLLSHTAWQTLWVEAREVEVPPEGSDLLVSIRRAQIWIRQPAEALVIMGPENGEADYLWASDGVHVLEIDARQSPPVRQEGQLPPFVRAPYDPPRVLSDTITGYPLAGSIGAPLIELVFPSGLAQRLGDYRVAGVDTVAGRAALIVDWTAPTGLIADRFRVDALTGLLLRDQVLGKTGGGEVVQSDRSVLDIRYDPVFPEGLFDLQAVDAPRFLAPPP
jgi:hypothetical protein